MCMEAYGGERLSYIRLAPNLTSHRWSGSKKLTGGEMDLFHQQLDILIETTKAERQKALQNLQPIFKQWQGLLVGVPPAQREARDHDHKRPNHDFALVSRWRLYFFGLDIPSHRL